MRVETPHFNNPWQQLGRVVDQVTYRIGPVFTDGLLRESLLNPKSYYRMFKPLSLVGRIPDALASSSENFFDHYLNFRPFIQSLTRSFTDLARRIH